jgi:hypothetical protein
VICETSLFVVSFEVIATLERAFPAYEITALYEEALELAREAKSWKGVLAVAESINDRLVGKPLQMIQRTNSSLAELLLEAREVQERLDGEREHVELIEKDDLSDAIEGRLSEVLCDAAVDA